MAQVKDSTERASAVPNLAQVQTRPYLFLVLECERPLEGGMRVSLQNVDEVHVGRGPERTVSRSKFTDTTIMILTIPDRQLSSKHARLLKSDGAWFIEDAGSTNGTFLRGERVRREPLTDGDLVELGLTVLLFREIDDAGVRRPGDSDMSELASLAEGLPTLDPVVAVTLERLMRLATSVVPMMLLGESGTGKELLARAIHARSLRPGPMIAVNCGAIPETLAESQLFGHMKGAFSGAVRDEKGFVRAADNGTLFLDEIGDLPPPSQAALLRVLQEGEVVPVGATKPVRVDIRVVCATHQPLQQLIASGHFRQDLFARLAGFSHTLSPLRDRQSDMGLLISALLRDPKLPRSADPGRGVPEPSRLRFRPEVARAFMRYDWPMNVRELKQCLSTSSVLAEDGLIGLTELPKAVANAANEPWDVSAADGLNAQPEADAALRHELITRLTETHGNVSQVAQAMGKARQQVQRWVRRLGIDPTSFRR